LGVTDEKQQDNGRVPRLFRGIRPINRAGAMRDVLAGFTLAAMNVPQALGYTRIAGTPVVTGLYTLLLPLVRLRRSALRVTWWWRRTRLRRRSSPAGCHRWRLSPARTMWRWREWWRC